MKQLNHIQVAGLIVLGSAIVAVIIITIVLVVANAAAIDSLTADIAQYLYRNDTERKILCTSIAVGLLLYILKRSGLKFRKN